MIKVKVAPRDIVAFWEDNLADLCKNYILLASNDENNTGI